MSNNQNSNSEQSNENGTKPKAAGSAVISEKELKLIDKWIAEMTEAGFTPDEMIIVFRQAAIKFDNLKNKKVCTTKLFKQKAGIPMFYFTEIEMMMGNLSEYLP